MARDFWIAEIRVPDSVEEKIRNKHNLTGNEIRAVCVPKQYISADWHTHPIYGERLLVDARDDRSLIQLILKPIDIQDGIWKLRTAWRML